MRTRLGLVALLGLVWLGCDSSNPVAPGTVDALAPANQYTITLTASSGSLFAGITEPVEVTITVLRNSDGAPAEDGLQVAVSTTLGNFGVDATNTPITLLTLTLRGGEAGFAFYPGDEPGTAELLARLADSAGSFKIQVVDPGDPPEAAFEFAPNGLEVLFSDASSGLPVKWSWDFEGDGMVDSEKQDPPVHTYPRDDVYRVVLTVEDAIGRTSTARQFVEVASSLKAAFEFEVGAELLTVIFTDASEGNPTSFAWSFGDGSGSEERDPVHPYEAAGEYVVSLTVSKGAASSSVSQFVVVGDLLVADFLFVLDRQCGYFTDTSTGAPEEWLWDFGDGKTSTEQNPTNDFPMVGEYVVKLIVKNAAGATSTATKQLEVEGTGATCP